MNYNVTPQSVNLNFVLDWMIRATITIEVNTDAELDKIS